MQRTIEYNRAQYGEEEKQAVMRVLDSPYLSGGEQTARFEDELAKWWGVRRALATSSGSTANLVAIQSLNLPRGSEVITPAGGAFPTTIAPLFYLNLKPVFVDIDMDTLCISPTEARQAVTRNTSAILFAHTLGRVADIDRLHKLAKDENLKVIQDSCDAMGSRDSQGRMAGSTGDVATVSFYPAHHMTTGGEGGAVLTNDTNVYREMRAVRDWGRDCVCRWGGKLPACGNRFRNGFDHRYYYTRIGLNFKMTEMQAAFGREQLKRVDGFNELRRRNYNILADRLNTPRVTGEAPFAFPVLRRNKEYTMQRLQDVGIQTRAIFTGDILQHPAFQKMEHRVAGSLKNSQRLFKEGFFVGCGAHLTENDMNYIADNLK